MTMNMKHRMTKPVSRWHLDVITGFFTEIGQSLFRPVSDTCHLLEAYERQSIEELFPAPDRIPDVKITRRWRLPGVVSEDLVFPSLHVPIEPTFRDRYLQQYQAVHRVYARRIRRSSARHRPRLLYLHGYMQPETYIEEFLLLANMSRRLNVEIIQMQVPYHGRRTPDTCRFDGEFFCTADLVRSIEALRQSFLDARTLLSFLLAEDPRPVGIVGVSLGGALTCTLTCLEERFAFSVPIIAHMDLARAVADVPVLGRMRRELRSFGWGIERFSKFVDSIGWNTLRPKLSADRILLIAASRDRFFDPHVVKRMWKDWGRPKIRWYPTSHMAFIMRLPEAFGVMRRSIDRWAANCHGRVRRRIANVRTIPIVNRVTG